MRHQHSCLGLAYLLGLKRRTAWNFKVFHLGLLLLLLLMDHTGGGTIFYCSNLHRHDELVVSTQIFRISVS
jgi:hypothetical protein